jgi:hypothetical protein
MLTIEHVLGGAPVAPVGGTEVATPDHLLETGSGYIQDALQRRIGQACG